MLSNSQNYQAPGLKLLHFLNFITTKLIKKLKTVKTKMEIFENLTCYYYY